MWLVLCEAGDIPALWAARGLKERGLSPMEIFTPEALAYSPRIAHRVSTSFATCEIRTADGRKLDSTAVQGTLNRLRSIPMAHLQGASTADRQYAEQELHALFLSMVWALPGRTLNPPVPYALGGSARHTVEWNWLAAEAGLAIYPRSYGSAVPAGLECPSSHLGSRTVVVLEGGCFGPPLSDDVNSACVRLARISGVPLLGIELMAELQGGWTFVDATPLPDLRVGGPTLLDALARELQA